MSTLNFVIKENYLKNIFYIYKICIGEASSSNLINLNIGF